jgi:hypothetical protein
MPSKEPSLPNLFIGQSRGNEHDVCIASSSQSHKALFQFVGYFTATMYDEPSFSHSNRLRGVRGGT